MMILGFRVLADPTHRVDTGQECRELDGSAQRAVGPLPAGQFGQCGVNLLIGENSHNQNGIPSLAMPTQIVVAGAVISGGMVLVAQRLRPPELAGRWELPGGKVAEGETEREALARELAEELGIEVSVGERLGDDVALTETLTMRAYRVHVSRGEPHPRDHRALRWVTAAELSKVDWVPADRAWLPDLAQALG